MIRTKKNGAQTAAAGPAPLPQLHPLKTVAARAGVALSTVFTWASTGQLPTVKLGRRRLVEESVLRAFLAGELTTEAAAK